ncbi:MAG: RHS repeat domain-containing protein [Chlamydiales bacterium]
MKYLFLLITSLICLLQFFLRATEPFSVMSMPYVISRVVEDANGSASACYLCDYDSNGRLVKESFYGNLSGSCLIPLEIEENGKPIPNGIESYSVSYEYSLDDPDPKLKMEETGNRNGIKELKTYDALGRLEHYTSINSLGLKISERDICYNANHQKTLERHYRIEQGHALGEFAIGWEYDSGGRLITIREGIGSSHQKNTHYHYNALNKLESTTQPNGATISYLYDDRGLLIKSRASDNSLDYEYQYDDLQRLVQIDDLLHCTSLFRRYDAFNRLAEERNGQSTVKYEYNLAGRCQSLTLPDKSQIRFYYQEGLLHIIERLAKDQSSLYKHTYEYSNGQLQGCQLIKNLGRVAYQYDEVGSLRNIASPWWSEKHSSDSYDDQGRLLSASIEDPKGSVSSFYTYAEDGQLIAEEGANVRNYSYDSLYNRLSYSNQDWVVNDINQLIQTPEVRYGYDANGNLSDKYTDQGHYSYVYDALNRLTSVTKEQEFLIQYRYDAFNRRIAENSHTWDAAHRTWQFDNSYEYIYDGENEIGKMDRQGQIVELRVLGIGRGAEIGATVALELNHRLFAPVHDCQGSVRCVIDAELGTVAEFYRYSCDGKEEIYDSQEKLIATSKISNPWRYYSKRVDEPSRLIFFGLRYYDPDIGRWTTPDPLFFYDTPNTYAFMKNDAVNHMDMYGLFSISSLWDSVKSSCSNFLQLASAHLQEHLSTGIRLPHAISNGLEEVGKIFVGDTTRLLFGSTPTGSHLAVYGEKEISDKVRVTFINGILTTQDKLEVNLELVSQCHGDVKVHYVFRGTNGWTSDITKAILIKTCYGLGYRSEHAYLLAQSWRELIEEMGGVGGGGVIIHYAHSLGGSDTDRARTLLTPEEQQMIRVITLGSSTLIRDEGFQSVVNIISANDGVSSIFLEPFGRIRNYFDSNSNLRVYGSFNIHFWEYAIWPNDHLLNGFTYKPILLQLGENFLNEFS